MWTRREVEREKYGGLAGRIASTDDHDILADAELRLHRRRAVVDTGALERRQVVERWPAVFGSCRDDYRARANLRSLVDVDRVPLPVAGHSGGAFCHDDLRAELQCLGVGAARQVEPRDAGRKAQVVLDP